MVTGHRRQSTGNAEPGRAPSELGSAGRRWQITATRLPATCPELQSSGGSEVRRGSAGDPPPEFFRVSGRPSFPQPFITTWRRRPLPAPSPHPNLDNPHAPVVADSPVPGILSFTSRSHSSVFLLSPAPSKSPPPPFQCLGRPFPLPSLQPGTLPLVRREKVFTSFPSSRESCLLPCSFLLLLGGICG